MAFLLDTNVLLRVITPSGPMHLEAVAACSILIEAGQELFAFPQNIAEFWRVCTRPKDKNGFGYTTKKADSEIDKLEGFVTVIPEHIDTYREWRSLVAKYRVKGVKVHDARIAAAMIAQGLTNLLSFNTSDFKRFSDINVFAPADIIASANLPVTPWAT